MTTEPVVRSAIAANFADGRVGDQNLQKKSIELGLWEDIGALVFDRVLRGEHKEWLIQLVASSGRSHRTLLHRLKKSRLGLWGSSIDLIGKQNIGENRALAKKEITAALIVFRQDVGAGDIGGHQVGGELDTGIWQLDCLGERMHK